MIGSTYFRRASTAFIFLMLGALLAGSNASAADQKIKVGVLKFGTVNWELKLMKQEALDAANSFDLKIVPFAGGDATKIALQGGAVDVIVSDWLWVSRMRAEGVQLTFVPYSSAVGAVMIPGDSEMTTLADLKGKKIGVAGGPLDKGWLMLQGMAKQEYGFDLAAENEIAYGAPPLLAEKTRSGELDAMLNFWHYCARLEADGFKRLVSVADAAGALGAPDPVSIIGYVFSDRWAADNMDAAEGFVRASRATKALLKDSDEQWNKLQEVGVIKDKGQALITLRDRFREGIPYRPVSDEMKDAATMYQILSELGGPKLVGKSATMMEGTYWQRLLTDL